MPLHGQRDLPVNRGMFGGMEWWGGEKGDELKLSSGGSSGEHWGLAGAGVGGGGLRTGIVWNVHPLRSILSRRNVAPSAVLLHRHLCLSFLFTRRWSSTICWSRFRITSRRSRTSGKGIAAVASLTTFQPSARVSPLWAGWLWWGRAAPTQRHEANTEY